MPRCEDCGCRTSGGICSNCQEELYIIEYQHEYVDLPLSNDFQNKAKEQKQYLKERKRLK